MTLSTYNGHDGPKRERVQRWLNEQWRASTLPRPRRCEACGQAAGSVQAHLENYDDPANYTPLCAVCHIMLHSRARNAEAWTRYKELVGHGYQHPTLPRGTNPFAALGATLLRRGWAPPGFEPCDRIDTYLDTIPDQQAYPGTNRQYGRTASSLF